MNNSSVMAAEQSTKSDSAGARQAAQIAGQLLLTKLHKIAEHGTNLSAAQSDLPRRKLVRFRGALALRDHLLYLNQLLADARNAFRALEASTADAAASTNAVEKIADAYDLLLAWDRHIALFSLRGINRRIHQSSRGLGGVFAARIQWHALRLTRRRVLLDNHEDIGLVTPPWIAQAVRELENHARKWIGIWTAAGIGAIAVLAACAFHILR